MKQLLAVSLVMTMLGLAVLPVTAQPVMIGVSLPQDDNPFYIAMLKGIRARAQELGWQVAYVSSNEDKLRQINGVQDLLARGVKGVLISPIDAVGVNAAYDAAAQAKIPIISIARGSASPNQTLHVAMDEKQIGRDIASWTAQRIGGKGKVAMISGPPGAPTFRNLNEGYLEVMAKYPGISSRASVASRWPRTRSWRTRTWRPSTRPTTTSRSARPRRWRRAGGSARRS